MGIDCQDIDAYEKMLHIGEVRQIEAIHQAELAQSHIKAERVLDELYKFQHAFQLTLDDLDQGEMALQSMGLLIRNVRDAIAACDAGVDGAFDCVDAALSAREGKST